MKNLLKFIATLILFLSSIICVHSQTQTIRGNVTDIDSKTDLPGVNVTITNITPVLFTTTDMDGNFSIPNVPLGRVDIEFSFIGYEERTVSNILVSSGKEVILNIKLSEAIIKLEDASVIAQTNKSKALNEMSQISARTLSVEETRRYAGAIDDPARMVSSFAGVNIDAEGNNSIIVRGNSSRGILWRLEGVEIPNPNHFAGDGATGGPINALNSAMLDNSDFLTGAFSAEYGNATSGVFDMNLRHGNNQKHERSASISVLGTDFTAEGPIKKNYSGSYLVNYRYSTLALLDGIGILDFGGVPKYQDASFKISLPTGDRHTFSLFGLGGLSNIEGTEEDELDDSRVIEKFDQEADLGILGLNHTYLISDRSYLVNKLNISSTNRKSSYSLPNSTGFFIAGSDDMIQTTKRFSSTYNYKVNARHKVKVGTTISNSTYDFLAQEHNFELNESQVTLKNSGEANTIQAYGSWKFRITDDISMVSGVHYLHFLLNDSKAIEPRWSINWDINKKHSIFGGFGIHSRHESISTYTAGIEDENGVTSSPNKDLDLTKAAHFTAGYSSKIGSFTSFKMEAYYQNLYDVPVNQEEGNTWSMINSMEYFITDKLENTGKGRNYGLEFTLERYFNNGFYYLSSLSLYNSEYKANDNQWHDTRFNGNYVANFLSGKEFSVGKSAKQKTMFINLKTALIGGRRYTPINLEESILTNDVVFQEDLPFTKKSDDIFKLDFAIGVRRNRERISTEWKVDIQNATNNAAVVDYYYHRDSQSIKESTQLSLLPVISYRVNF